MNTFASLILALGLVLGMSNPVHAQSLPAEYCSNVYSDIPDFNVNDPQLLDAMDSIRQ